MKQPLTTITLQANYQDQVQKINMKNCPYLQPTTAKQHLITILQDTIQLLQNNTTNT